MPSIDTLGQRFGALTVIKRGDDYAPPSGARHVMRWLCRCDCGEERLHTGAILRAGRAKSCGCLRNDGHAGATHGHSRVGRVVPEYNAWIKLKSRCENTSDRFFCDYGARGITVCDRWRHDFPAFLADMGPRPSPRHSIDRIDNARGYEPGNCRWATASEQARNTRRVHPVTAFGVTRILIEWQEATGIPAHVIRKRLRRGWDAERSVSEPVATP